MPQKVTVRKALSDDLCILFKMEGGGEANKAYLEQVFLSQKEGCLEIFIAKCEEEDAAFCFYNKNPKYSPFRKLGIPEIQGLFVHPDYRRQGIAKALITFCEALAREEGRDMIGISVGLLSIFGGAQKLYISMGYEPDGQGLVYDRAPVFYGETRIVDNDLCLMLLKSL